MIISSLLSPQQNFISKCLESKETTITKLNDDGEKLTAAEHPGKNVIEVQVHQSALFTSVLCAVAFSLYEYLGLHVSFLGIPQGPIEFLFFLPCMFLGFILNCGFIAHMIYGWCTTSWLSLRGHISFHDFFILLQFCYHSFKN